MIDFIEYVVAELQSKRLSKTNALSLIRQFGSRRAASNAFVMHPLVHRNTSDLTQQSYGSRFDGAESFLRDHRVQGSKVLPGVAYLEMARAAISHALPDRPDGAVFELRNVVWAQPIVVDQPKEIALAVFPEQGEQLGFEIYSTDEQEIVHCQGQAFFSTVTAPAKRDVSMLRTESSRLQLEAPVMYAAMLATGVDIGPSHRGVKTIHRGEQQLLAEIALPGVMEGSLPEYVLHPSVLDSAVQAATALIIEPSSDKGRPPLPFALESLRVFSACTQEMFAWVRYASGSRREDRVIKLDIDLCDADGNVCVQLLGFSSRVPGSEANDAQVGTLFAAPAWEVSDAGLSNAGNAGYAQRHVVLLDLPAVNAEELPGISSVRAVTADYGDAAVASFEAIQAVLKSKPHGQVLIQIVAPESDEGLLYAGLGGLLGTATRENPQLATQLIFTRREIGTDELMSQLRREGSSTPEPIVRYASGGRSVRRWQELSESEQVLQPAFKNDGVYLISGGLGAVGLLFAKEILSRTSEARVVLTGRAPLSADKQATLDALGARVLYRQLDLGDADQVAALVASIIEELGQLNGILHGAGMVQDNFILKKSAAEFRDVLAPKVAGTVHLDRATAAVDLDFLALFSSVSAVFGNPGQADYTAANGFMDAFATYRNRQVASKQRYGRTVSINWPLWLEGGMQLDPVNQRQLRRTTGMHPMRTETGMRAFHRSLLAEQDQVLVVEGDLMQLRSSLLSERPAPTVAEPAVVIEDSDLARQTQDYLRKQFSVVLKLAPHRIDAQAPLEKYGIDSIVAMDLTAQLELTFGSLPKTLFFEYQTIRELTDYFVREHAAKLSGLFTKVASRAPEKPVAAKPQSVPTSRRRKRLRHVETARPTNAEPIAIVGLSGRYPQSIDLDAYWQNLKNGRDCITEVPKERWDWRDYFTEDRTAPGAHYSKWGGFIDGVDEFDPLFFNIPPVDAELIDPQERLFLQHAWMAIEDAGYTRASLQIPHDKDLAGQVGVYVGVMYGEYQLFGAEASLKGRRVGLPVSYASIANRVSYLMNLHGPSMALDTMCSSSLSAIHLACQDLKQGRTNLAIAGGVNVSIHPNKYLILSSGQYISSDGHCQSFGAGGDGYIPGEGVGVVILKRLSDAQRDGNYVYGLIKGTALNHGGKTNGYTVPNLPAQASVISRAFKECGVDARHISYIEAHGTGTKLGDPIEVAALAHAFRQHTQDRQFCRLGSAKSNIGHCESAAGIAGLTKVLLQMKHRQIAPSLHSAQLNPHIDFEQSPFVVNQSLRAWEQPEINGTTLPRIAGISSFGAGGSNAHVIIEEYSASSIESTTEQGPLVFPLSARTQEQLKHKARDLAAFIERQPHEIDLRSMAYTLQVGREAMDVRLGLVADSAAQLAEKLRAYVQGETSIEDVFQGRATQDEEGVAALGHDEDMAAALDKWIARGKFSKLLELWVKGLDVDWRKLHGDRKPRLCSLPTYPFAKQRYWIATTPRRTQTSRFATDVHHPLVHTNTSDLHQQSYTTVFTGDERVLADHQIETGGARLKILPGVAYLEMVRAAVDLALPAAEPRSLELQNTAWLQPLVVDGEQQVSVSLLASDATCVDFEVTSGAETVHCQGRVTVRDASAPARLDVDALRSRMTRGQLSAKETYDVFTAMGIHYGDAFRCVTVIQRGQGELLAELTLDEANREQMAGCMLHPGLLDSALQAALGLVENLGAVPRQPAVPFALDTLRIHAPLTSRMFSWVRYAANSDRAGDITKVDIDLCDASGTVCAQIVGLTSRTLSEPQKKSGSLLARPVWETNELDFAAADHQADDVRRVVVLLDVPTVNAQRLAALLPGVGIKTPALLGSESVADRYRQAAVACFDEVQTLLQSAPAEKVLLQVVVNDELLAGLSGLLRTVRIENPNVVGQVILGGANDAPTLARQLRAARSDEALIKYEQARQSVLRWKAETLQDAGPIAFRNGGVYVITGGLGGLGVAFAKEILTRAEGTKVVLTGRSELDGSKHSAIEKLAIDAPASLDRIVYRQLDLSRAEEVQCFVTGVVTDFGAIHGVIHSAGMTQDRLLAHKSREELLAVLEPKVAGTVNLDLATSEVELDFMMLCSSMSAVFGNAGQADYAAANGFLDMFATYRNELVKQGRRRGQTLSINWPLWEEGGMKLDRDAADLLARRTGIVPMQTQTGLQAFYRGIELRASRALVVEGDVARMRQLIEPSQALVAPEVKEASASSADANELLAKTQQLLGKQLATLLKLPAHEVDAKAPLEKYGMDSVLAMKWTDRLEQLFGSLSKTLLFEHQTIASLAGYLLKSFPHIIQQQVGVSTAVTKDGVPVSQPVVARSARSKSRFVQAGKAVAEREVAIIGVGGRYPLAADLNQFWENLKAGRDCITEIPEERWKHRSFYHPERNQPGKAYSKWGGFLGGVDQFDPLFFNISPREAELIDPQERLFLETVWETIEDAGYSKDAIARNRVGVYVGVMWGQYELYGVAGARSGVPSSSFASIANRVSYFFDFHGPSLALDTMCSSSLTAIHLASEEIRKGAIDVAIAGGVNVSIHPNKYLSLSQGNFASTDGRCRSFGAGGDGYVPGEGVGAVLLKSLERALADGDQIYAIVRASSINHGGKTNGYTVPNPRAQSEVIAQALAKAQIDPATLGYIETHGTGTALGDPIEISGLLQAFSGAGRSCAIGSVKSNIGHLESAAGIAAVTKVLLQLKHRQLVPSLHAEPANPNIDFAQTPFRVQTKLEDWQSAPGLPRRAGVSSFGAGGANAHLILEEFVDAREPWLVPARPEIVVLSARSRASLVLYVEKMLAFLQVSPDVSLAQVAYTSQVGRTAMQERLVIVAASIAALKDKLAQWLRDATQAVDDIYGGSLKDSRSSAAALLDGQVGQELIRLTIEKRDLAKLAQLWIAGAEIKWAALHGANPPKKVSLPTYPFVRQRYWLDADASALSVAQSEPAPRRELVYYRPEWRSAELAPAGDALGPVMILDGDDRLLTQLRAEPGTILVKPAAAFERVAANVFNVDWSSEADVSRLIETLQAEGSLPRTFIHHDAGGPEQAVHALHHLCKALMKQKLKDGVRIISIRASASDEHTAMHAALGGFFKTLSLENPKFVGKVVEAASTPELATLIRRELAESNWKNCEIRYLDACREVRGFQRFAPSERAAPSTGLKQGGVYLVTGGLGGLGYLFSEYLAKQYQARLVLIGRSKLGDEQERKLAGLASHSNEAIYLQADVTNGADVDAVVREIKQKFSRLDGVVHAAGMHHDAYLLNKTTEQMRSVLAAKVAGTIHLDRATAEQPPDLFILFSSLAGALGNPGQSDYAFANSFLDAFAARRQQSRPGRTLSINWPFWEDGGMALSAGDIELAERRAGIAPLRTGQGLQCFEALLGSDCTQAIAIHGVAAKVDAYVLNTFASEPRLVETSVRPVETGELTRRTVGYLQSLLAKETKLTPEQVDAQERFESFGIDSMMIGRINATMEADLGELPKTLFYEYSTSEELAAHLVQTAQSALTRLFDMQPTAVESAPRPQAMSDHPASVQPTAIAESEPIAIIGVHGSFPHSETLHDYWENLKAGKDLVDAVPASRWDWHEFFDADPANAKDGKIYCASGGFLADVDKFDAAFFQISPQDARLMDPQERLFLQSTWAAIEDAGYTRESLKRHFPKARSADVGVFVGVTTNTYHLLTPEEWSRGNMVTPGSLPWSIANRVSYFFDFQGPSMPVDTACSSSLVAMQLACDSLRSGECRVAIAGGVNLYLHPSKYQSFCSRRMLAMEGKCRSFGAGDDGFIPGEAVGTLVLKPLSKALEHGDHIYALIAASVSEHSGRSNGYSAPNPSSQANLIAQALSKAGVSAQSIGYIEGHGTGTQLGDSLEIASLTQAFQRTTDKKQFCAIGSVKANIGHAESAAGIAGVAKVLMQMKHGEIAPTIHSDAVNPNIDFKGSPFYLQHALAPWRATDDQPRRAMINAFGAGGVNSCVILQEYRREVAVGARTARVIVLSARTSDALRSVVLQLRKFLSRESSVDMARLAYTLQVGREAMSERLAIVVSDAVELRSELEKYLAGAVSDKAARGCVRKVSKHVTQETDPVTLARLWVEGQQIEWEGRYKEQPVRLPLPTYPFARERHWVSDAPSKEKRNVSPPVAARLHPLVTANVSTLKEVAFSSTLSSQEYYARDHKVSGEMFFPGAGFLEIACINGTIAGERKVSSIRDLVWSRPLKFGASSPTVKTFLKSSGDATEYVIVSLDEENERVVHSEGRLLHAAERNHRAEVGAVATIQSLRARCSRVIERAECYRTFEQHGLQYGDTFQTIQELHVGDGCALAKLQLGDALLKDFEHYILHPCLIDGALQSVIGLASGGASDSPYLPFALDEVEILRPLPSSCYAYVEPVAGQQQHPDIRRFNITLLNESGHALVKLNHFHVRALRTTRSAPQADTARALAAAFV